MQRWTRTTFALELSAPAVTSIDSRWYISTGTVGGSHGKEGRGKEVEMPEGLTWNLVNRQPQIL